MNANAGAGDAGEASRSNHAGTAPDHYGVYAAGGVVWRGGREHPALSNLGKAPLEVLLVHRPKYDDWSFPKGKIEPGELLTGCAVREIAEETGLQVCLGPKLGVTDYPVDGIDKQVTYWLANTRSTPAVLARAYAEPALPEEIDRKEWVALSQAPDWLTQEFDKSLALKAQEALKDGWGRSRPLVLLRHAKAKKREKWRTDDALRPLKKKGKKQAKAQVSTLSAFGVSEVVSSPWKRCEETVIPYVKATVATTRFFDALSEEGHRANPEEAKLLFDRCFEETLRKGATVICTHRPVLDDLLNHLEQKLRASGFDPAQTDLSPLALGEAMVVHLAPDEDGARAIAVERYLPTSSENTW